MIRWGIMELTVIIAGTHLSTYYLIDSPSRYEIEP